MTTELNEISVNGITYVPKNPISNPVINTKGLEYVMVRTYSAGVFAGYMSSREGLEGILLDAQCIYYWDGANTILQLATEGTTKPENCKFTIKVPVVILTQIIEIIPITQKAKESFEKVKIWDK